MAHVGVLGSINQDIVVTCPRAPLIGETVHGSTVEYFPGGKGSNQAVACARFGAAVAFFGCIGSEPAGQVMQWNFDANHIDRRHVRICEDVPTGTALITVDGTGDNSIVVVPGANAELSEEDIEGLAREGFGHGDVLVCQLEVPREIVNGALVRGHSLGMTTILNAAPAEDVRDILSAVDVLVVNETEIQPNIGGEFDTREELIERTVALSCDSQTAVVVTLGDEGCIVCDGREVLDIPARRVHVVDTTGAGDTFVGVLSACLAEGMTINKAGQISAAAGSLATTKKGAQSGMPSAEAVYEFMRTH